MQWPFRWPHRRLHKLTDKVSENDRTWAEALADKASSETIPALTYTEHRVEWVLLRKHATRGQIKPSMLKRMKREDLEYLAGMTNMHPVHQLEYEVQRTAQPQDPSRLKKARASLEEEVKVVENAVRATRELERRSRVLIQMIVVGIAAAAAIAAAMIERQAWPFVDGRGWPW
jgi:hypothetical protein